MIKNIEEAKKVINEIDQVVTFLTAESLDENETYTKTFIESVASNNPTWRVQEVNIVEEMNYRVNKGLAPLYFETDTYPEMYIHKSQSRAVVVRRVLSMEEIHSLLSEVEEGSMQLAYNGSSK